MKNYQNSDYALNKFSKGIVYAFADGTKLTVMPEDYLSGTDSAPDWKAISDADYLDRVRAECRSTRKDISFQDMDHTGDFSSDTPDDEYIEKLDKLAAAKAFDSLLASGKLTETQERRFRLHYFGGLSHRKIATQEGVTYHAVAQSLHTVAEQLKILFENS